MSYCRFSEDSDVYMYRAATGYVCCGCQLKEDMAAYLAWEEGKGPGGPIFTTAEEAFVHLQRHGDVGHKVPRSALERLQDERPDRDQ